MFDDKDPQETHYMGVATIALLPLAHDHVINGCYQLLTVSVCACMHACMCVCCVCARICMCVCYMYASVCVQGRRNILKNRGARLC